MPKKAQYTKRHYVRITPESDAQLKKFAKSLGLSVGAALRFVVEHALDHYETKKGAKR